MENLFNNRNVFKYGKSNKEVNAEMFIQNIYVTVMKNPITYDVFIERIFKSIKKICRFRQGNGKGCVWFKICEQIKN